MIFFRSDVHFKSKPSKVVRKEGDPFFDVSPGFKKNVPSSTWSIQNKSNSIPDEKVPVWWITNCPIDLGELSLRANWALLSPRAVHLSSSVSEKAIIKNRNITGAILYPCLTPTFNSMDASTFPVISLTIILLYMCLIAENSLGGAPYFPSMAMNSA